MIPYIMEIEQTEVDLGIEIGMIFRDLEKFERDLASACKSKYVQLYKKDARTIKSAVKKRITRALDPKLQFYSIRWCCIYGGKKYKSRGKGLRKVKTLRKEDLCPAYVQIRIANSGTEFIVSGVNFMHNHVVKKDLFKQLAHNRRLPNELKIHIIKLLDMKTSKKLIKEILETKFNFKITIKDLTNLQQMSKIDIKDNIELDTPNLHCFAENNDTVPPTDVELSSTHRVTQIVKLVGENTRIKCQKSFLTLEEKYKMCLNKVKLIGKLSHDLPKEQICNTNSILDAIIGNIQNELNGFIESAVCLITTNNSNNILSNDDIDTQNASAEIGTEDDDKQTYVYLKQDFPYGDQDFGIREEIVETTEIAETVFAKKAQILTNKDVGGKCAQQVTMHDLVPFCKKTLNERIEILLCWMVKEIQIVNRRKIEIGDLLPMRLIDRRILEVNIGLVKHLFSKCAWNKIVELQNKIIRDTVNCLCYSCKEIVYHDTVMRCDYCLHWNHFNCGVSENADLTICKNCMEINISN